MAEPQLLHSLRGYQNSPAPSACSRQHLNSGLAQRCQHGIGRAAAHISCQRTGRTVPSCPDAIDMVRNRGSYSTWVRAMVALPHAAAGIRFPTNAPMGKHAAPLTRSAHTPPYSPTHWNKVLIRQSPPAFRKMCLHQRIR
jgi:hypothetical protein